MRNFLEGLWFFFIQALSLAVAASGIWMLSTRPVMGWDAVLMGLMTIVTAASFLLMTVAAGNALREWIP